MARVSINGYRLHEIEMLMTPYSANTVSYLKYPEHRIESRIEGDKLLLKVPALLAVELYRRAILPQNPTEDVSVTLDERDVGRFVVIDFRYPNSLARTREAVSITLQRVYQEDAQAQEANEVKPSITKEELRALKQRYKARKRR